MNSKRSIFSRIGEWFKDWIEYVWDEYTSSIEFACDPIQRSNYYDGKAPAVFRFPSLLTAGLRKAVKALPYIIIAIAIISLAVIIKGLVVDIIAEIFILKIVLNVILAALSCVLIYVVVPVMFIAIILLIESIAKQVASLLVYKSLCDELENPMDCLVCKVLHIYNPYFSKAKKY